jgi:hypothetical protein
LELSSVESHPGCETIPSPLQNVVATFVDELCIPSFDFGQALCQMVPSFVYVFFRYHLVTAFIPSPLLVLANFEAFLGEDFEAPLLERPVSSPDG